MNIDLQPRLENDLVTLAPLQVKDYKALYKVASDPLIWEQHPIKNRCQKDGFTKFFEESIASKGTLLVIHKLTSDVIGSSRYKTLAGNPDKIEIGWSFLSRAYWGGAYNKAVKELMIDHAFHFVDDVIFFIDKTNIRSQKAVEKLGALLIPEPNNLDVKSNVNLSFVINKHIWQS